MERVKINTPYDPEIQLPKAYFPEVKLQELTSLLNASDRLAEAYFKASEDSVARRDKQMKSGSLVLFDRGYEIVVYKYSAGNRDFVAQYERGIQI